MRARSWALRKDLNPSTRNTAWDALNEILRNTVIVQSIVSWRKGVRGSRLEAVLSPRLSLHRPSQLTQDAHHRVLVLYALAHLVEEVRAPLRSGNAEEAERHLPDEGRRASHRDGLVERREDGAGDGAAGGLLRKAHVQEERPAGEEGGGGLDGGGRAPLQLVVNDLPAVSRVLCGAGVA